METVTALGSVHHAVFDTTPLPQNATRRMSYADFMGDFGAWLVRRSLAQFPNLAGPNVLGQLRAYSDSNEFYVARSGDSVIFARLVRRLFNEPPYVECDFLFCRPDEAGLRRDEAESEGLALLTDVIRWSRSMGCSEARMPRVLDIPVMSFKKLPTPPSQMTVHKVDADK